MCGGGRPSRAFAQAPIPAPTSASAPAPAPAPAFALTPAPGMGRGEGMDGGEGTGGGGAKGTGGGMGGGVLPAAPDPDVTHLRGVVNEVDEVTGPDLPSAQHVRWCDSLAGLPQRGLPRPQAVQLKPKRCRCKACVLRPPDLAPQRVWGLHTPSVASRCGMWQSHRRYRDPGTALPRAVPARHLQQTQRGIQLQKADWRTECEKVHGVLD